MRQPVMEDAPMAADLFNRLSIASPVATQQPDTAFAARERFLSLRDAFALAAKTLRPRWDEPGVFFFDKKRDAELAATRQAVPDRFAELTALVAAEMPMLLASVETRRVARAVGLKDAARILAAHCAAAKDLTDLLAIPDDEVFLAITPATHTGVRLHVRGAANVAQLHQLLARPHLPTPSPRGRGGEREPPSSSPSPPGGGGREVGSPADFQLFTPAALQADGTLHAGFAGCGHWLWPTQPLTAVPRVNGERVVLIGPATVRASLDVEVRFPELAVECEWIETLNAIQVAENLSRLCGRSIAVPVPNVIPPIARAA
jgi:hypothetical protein